MIVPQVRFGVASRRSKIIFHLRTPRISILNNFVTNYPPHNIKNDLNSAMPQASDGRLQSGDDLKRFSCLTCRQRKIKCDRRSPCSHCVKASTQCSFIPPVRGKRKVTKPPKEGLHSKLKRYEAMLKSYGAKIEPSDDENASDAEAASQADTEMAEAEGTTPHKKTSGEDFTFEKSKSRLVSKDGSSRYFDK